MDDQRFGALIRATRIRRRMTQKQVARSAGVSDSAVSRLERGFIDSMPMGTVRAIARVLDARVELLPRSRTADLERVAGAAHAALAEAFVGWLRGFADWIVRPEVGFSHYGDRGVIDLVAWHPVLRILLVIELKTELVDINELLGTLDRYARNAVAAVAPLEWRPLMVARLLVVGDSDFNRSRVRDHAGLFGAALPHRVGAVRRWLAKPGGELAGLIFFANRHPRTINAKVATVRRVRGPNRPRPASLARSAEHE